MMDDGDTGGVGRLPGVAGQNRCAIIFVQASSAMAGVEFSTLYLVQHLDKARFSYLVICPAEGDLPRRCREHQIPVRIIPRAHFFSTSMRLGRWYIPNPLAWTANSLAFVASAARLAVELRRQPADLVCTKGMSAHFYGGLAARLVGVPCVWHIQDRVSERAGTLYAHVLGLAARHLARQVIVDGASIQEQLAPYSGRDRLTVIHNGVDTDTISPHVDGRAVRAEWEVGDGEVLIGNVARLTPWKGQDCLIRAFSAILPRYPEAKLALIGAPVFDSDAYERELRQLARDLGIEKRVIFAGFRWDLPQVLAALDIYAHPSIEKDTSPLAVVSAMAAGKAIVSTNVSGLAELFAPGEAILVQAADVRALVEGLQEVLVNADIRLALGRAARLKAEQRLSLNRFTEQCEAVFVRTLSEGNVPPHRTRRLGHKMG